ncbi:MAG: hypothetical protein KJ886_05780 [Candidatus Thermoplasmatota archaeon]|nr:hypothetical protein [Candidatus Thermoplasmatota archaeon]MCG2827533.1 hypothetical protein [Thermoplasmatales archaeon]
MGKCKHSWKGHGTERVCTKCGKPPHKLYTPSTKAPESKEIGKKKYSKEESDKSWEERNKLVEMKELDKTIYPELYENKGVLSRKMGKRYHAIKLEHGKEGGPRDDEAFNKVGEEFQEYLDALKIKDYHTVWEMMQHDPRFVEYSWCKVKEKTGNEET